MNVALPMNIIAPLLAGLFVTSFFYEMVYWANYDPILNHSRHFCDIFCAV